MPRLIVPSTCWLLAACLLYGCQGNQTTTGENLWAAGRTEAVSTVPQDAMIIAVSDDGECTIDHHRFASLDDGIAWLRRESKMRTDTVLMALSKRASIENQTASLCEWATQRNANLYGCWPISGACLLVRRR